MLGVGLTTRSQWDWGLGSFLTMDPEFWCSVTWALCLRQGPPSCWKEHYQSPKLFMDGWRSVWVPFFSHSFVLRQHHEWVHSLGWEATPHMNSLRMLYCWHDRGLAVTFTVSPLDMLVSGCSKQSERGIHQRKRHYHSPQRSDPCTFCRISVRPWFPGKKWLLCGPSWLQAILQKSSPHCACRCTHICLLQLLPAAESTLGDGSDTCWTSLSEVLDDTINSWFRCNLSSDVLACEALFFAKRWWLHVFPCRWSWLTEEEQ